MESTSLIGDMGDPNAPRGSDAWCRWVHFETLRRLENREEAGERLERIVSVLQESEAWAPLADRNGRSFIDFADYCQTPPPYGLGRTTDVLRQEIALRSGPGRPRKDEKRDGITISQSRGTSGVYITARLKRDRPDLAERVEAGEMTAHAAAIEAGFREKASTFPLTARGAVRLLGKLSPETRAEVARQMGWTPP